MANNEIVEHLQYHGQAGESGCLNVHAADGNYATIFLLEGEVVYAQTADDFGVSAFFIALGWEDASTAWEPGKQPPRLICREPFDSLLFQYAQLEDNAQTDPDSIRSLYGEVTAGNDVKLLDLNHYAISFEVLNTDFKGFIFYLEKAESLIGRMEDCDVILPDASISSHHCKLQQDRNHIRVLDLGSTNGTRINGQLIDEGILQVGDEFQIGAVLITMHVKLKRKLDQDALSRLESQATGKTAYPSGTATSKLDPKKLRHTTDKIQGPITWKNLSTEQKKGRQSLFSGLFKKK